MKKLEISLKQRQLIESVVKEHPKFPMFSDMLDNICESIYKKSYLLIDTIKDEQRLKRHLSMVCESCINELIKKKRPEINLPPQKDVKDEIVSIKRQPQSLNQNNEIKKENIQKSSQNEKKYAPTESLIDPIKVYPLKIESLDVLDNLIKTIKMLDGKYPNKDFYKLFCMRYIQFYSQSEIARELKISQAELSKRLIELVGLIQ